MDFTVEVVEFDDSERVVTFRLIPDPRRYSRTTIEGDVLYIDKYLRTAIPEKIMLGKASEQAKNLPLYALSARISSTSSYAAARKVALQLELEDGSYVPPTEQPAQHRSFDAASSPKRIVFLSVDICESTRLRRSNPATFDHAYALFLRELATVVGQFNGTILKTTGDGFIAYIDHPAFTQQCDHAIDLGIALIVVLRDSINPTLSEAGLPILRVRIGADFGDAIVRNVAVPSTGFLAPEIASDALNRAVKIQESAADNEFRIGRTLYELVHVQWLERAHEVPFDGASLGLTQYSVYRII